MRDLGHFDYRRLRSRHLTNIVGFHRAAVVGLRELDTHAQQRVARRGTGIMIPEHDVEEKRRTLRDDRPDVDL